MLGAGIFTMASKSDHVIGAEAAAYKARYGPSAVTLRNGKACGKYIPYLSSARGSSL
jgi:hypothetical protein